MIVVGGEALVDLVPDPSTRRGELGPLLPRLGGGPYNTAVALGRLGAPVAFLSRVSRDAFGDALVERLVGAGVDIRFVQRGPEPTTLAVVTLAADGSARYTFHVAGTADRLVADPGALPDELTTLSVGTLGMVLEPGASVYEAMLRRESERGRLVVVDPNVRTGLIEDADAYRARFRSWLSHITVLKASVEDACWLAELPAESPIEQVEAVVREWLDAGVSAVVLTRGGDGLSSFTASGDKIEVPAVRATVADTIGAGDTVHAALLAWLSQHGVESAGQVRKLEAKDWSEALGFAARAAAITVSRVGAEPPFAAELA
ncbi:MAG TPA: carbohydrate kinase [Pseudonocardiaceae bacterium]|nr:carbohydrate kinase [Pseudonocardiaceae bacterium]